MNFFKKRKIIKVSGEILRHANHLRNMRGDLLRDFELEKLASAQDDLKKALSERDIEGMDRAGDVLYSMVLKLSPKLSMPGVREHVEIFVVAVSVAMAVRTYFLQPFKIPTGSMQPTLWGITSFSQEKPGFMDRMPLKFVKWFGTGEWYRCVKVTKAGILERVVTCPPYDPANYHYYIGGRKKPYKVPIDAHRKREVRQVSLGDMIPEGTVLWSGIVIAGDHVFVDKVRWNMFDPARDQIIVFNTDDIKMSSPVPPGTHYIKRLVGLPGERMSIKRPNVLADGVAITNESGIARVTETIGYRTINGRDDAGSRSPLFTEFDSIQLLENEYFPLGDNQASSKDGRYWGAVEKNALVGPALLIYWPFVRLNHETGRHYRHFGMPE